MEPAPATTKVTKSDKRAGIARRILVGAGAIFILYGVVGAFVVPPIAKRQIAQRLGGKLGRAVEIDRVSVNPYTLAASVEGVRILEADRKTVFAQLDRLDLDASISSLTRLAPVVDEMAIDGLRVRLVRDAENHYNASDILARLAQAPAPAAKPEEPPRFSLSNIRIARGRIDFDDRPLGTKHEITDIEVAIPFASNLPRHLKEFVQPRLSARVNGAPLAVRGETLPFENSLRTHVALNIDGFDLPRYMGYSPTPLPVKLQAGKLGGRVEMRFTHAQGKEPSIELSGRLALRDVAIGTESGELAKVSEIAADGVHVDVLAKDVAIESLALRSGSAALQRRADGSLDLPSMPDSPAATQPVRPWHIKVAKATVDDLAVEVRDAAVKPAAVHHVAITHVEARDWSTDKDAKVGVAARLALDKGGTIEADGTVALDPLVVDAKVDARHIDLVPLRPYVAYFATVKLKSALASAKGQLQLRGAGPGIKVAYAGGAEVSRVATVDTVSKEDLLNWDSVRVDGMALRLAHDEAVQVAIKDITVNRMYSRVVVTPEGRINLQQLKLATEDDPAPAPEAKENLKPRQVRIDRVRIVDSRLNFTDHYIKPNYTADVGDLNGTVTGLSSEPSARGVVDLKGSYDKSSPVLIAGTINPLSGDLFLDVGAKGTDIELPRLSAYSMRYAGYPIKSGKLTLDVKYHVENGALDGRNKITLDQLTFGDKVESPEATKLPVLFAVNLLKDANGRIALELPIKGSLEDPQFDMSALIGQVVSNLLKKALTSPFQLLAAALGGGGNAGNAGADAGAAATAAAASGDDLAYVSFTAGSADVSDAERAKLERITKALRDRPALKLEMAAHAGSKDAAALQDREAGPIPPDALKALAARRAELVKGYLTAEGRLAADRVSLASGEAGDTATVATRVSRVDFTLK